MEWSRIIGLHRDTSYFDYMEDCDIKTIIKHGKYNNLIRIGLLEENEQHISYMFCEVLTYHSTYKHNLELYKNLDVFNTRISHLLLMDNRLIIIKTKNNEPCDVTMNDLLMLRL